MNSDTSATAAATDEYVLTHSMLRVKDLDRSLNFYREVLGMRLAKRLDFEESRFTLAFLQPAGHRDQVDGSLERTFSAPGLLELTYNWGTENDPEVNMHSGNEEPKGFGHICIAVPNIEEACKRFDNLGVEFQKRLGQGGMKEIAFIKDPDGYWIEIVQPNLMQQVVGGADRGG